MGKLLGTLVVIVLKAKNLPNKQRIGKQDAYATIVYRGQRNKTQVVRKAGQHPVFDDEFRYEVREDVEEEVHAEVTASGGVKPASQTKKPSKSRTLKLSVFSDDPMDPKLIGDAIIDFESTMVKGEFDEWITLNDVQKKYAGEVFIEMTYYDQTRKAGRPRSAAEEFGALPPGLRANGISQQGLRASSSGSAGPQLRASTSYNRLSSAGIEPYAPNYASGLIPSGREGSPSTTIGKSPLSGPPRHNSLNDADIAAFSASINASSMGRKPLPLPGSPSVNAANLPASFHAHRLSLPTFEGVGSSQPPRALPYEPKLPAQPEAEPSFGRLLPGIPGDKPSGIEGWRTRVHSETNAPDSLPERRASGALSPSSQSSYSSIGPSTSQRQSPSPRPFPPLAAPGLPPNSSPGPHSAPPMMLSRDALDIQNYAQEVHDLQQGIARMPFGTNLPVQSPDIPGLMHELLPQNASASAQAAYGSTVNGFSPSLQSRIPPGYVPGPPPPGFRPPSQSMNSLPRPPSQSFQPGHPALSQPAQRPFETLAYPPPNGHSVDAQRPFQTSPDPLESDEWRQPTPSQPLYNVGGTISGMAGRPEVPPRPPEQLRPQVARAPSPVMPGGYAQTSPSSDTFTNAPLRYASAQHAPHLAAMPPPQRASSYGGPLPHEPAPAPGVVRPLPVRPEQPSPTKPVYAPQQQQQAMYYEPPRR